VALWGVRIELAVDTVLDDFVKNFVQLLDVDEIVLRQVSSNAASGAVHAVAREVTGIYCWLEKGIWEN
jgi:hypothetical protein